MTPRRYMGIDTAANGGSVPVWPTLVQVGAGVAVGYVVAKLLLGRRLRENPLPWRLVPGTRDKESFAVYHGADMIGYVIKMASGHSAHNDEGAVIAGPIDSPVIAGAIVYNNWMESLGSAKTLAHPRGTRPGYMGNPEWRVKKINRAEVELFVGDEEIGYGVNTENGWFFYPSEIGPGTLAAGIQNLNAAAKQAYENWAAYKAGRKVAPVETKPLLEVFGPSEAPSVVEEGPELWKVFERAEQEAERRAEQAEKKIAKRKVRFQLTHEQIKDAICHLVREARARGKRKRKWAAPISDAEVASLLGVTVKAARDAGIALANDGIIYAHTMLRLVPEATMVRDKRGRLLVTSQKKRRKRTMFAEYGPRGQKGHFEHKGAPR